MHTQKINETPLDFAEAIKEDIKSSKDEGVLKCVQCGMCTSTCPAARHSNYNPREIMERVFEGDETLLEDEDLWKCFFKSIAIEERNNPVCQRSFLPLRYRKYMTEFQ